jgi:hypothetical protein
MANKEADNTQGKTENFVINDLVFEEDSLL